MNRVARAGGLVVLGVAALGLAGWLGLRHSGSGSTERAGVLAQPRPKVITTLAKRGPMAHRVSVNATVEPWEQAELFGKVVAYVAEVRVDIGDNVKAGDLLVALDAPELTSTLHQTEAARAAQVEAVRAAEASVGRSRRALDVAGRELDVLRADLNLAEATLKRKTTVGDGRAISEQEMDEARARAESVRAQVAAGEARVAGAQADLQVSVAGFALAKAQQEAAVAQVEQAATMVGYLRITAPFDGVVTRRYVDRGAMVHAPPSAHASPLLTVQRTDPLRVVCDIPEREAVRVRVNDPVTVALTGLQGAALEARVSRVAGGLDPASRTLRTQIDLANSDGRIRPGAYAQVIIESERREGVLTVPVSALLPGDGGESVLIVRDGKLDRARVKIGLGDSGRVEVLEGLAENQEIVVSAKGAPPPGAEIEAVREP